MSVMQKYNPSPYGLLEFKSMNLMPTDIDTKNGIVTGYWSSFGNLDYDEDVIKSGAFAKTIAERGPMGSNDIFFLNQHNWTQPLGKPTVLREDEKGLYHETPVNANTSYGKDALELMGSGLVIQNSIGFVPMKWSNVVKDDAQYDWDTYREITECKLYEGSCVTLGANDQTPFTGFKSLTPQQINDQVGIMMKLMRNGTLTDESFALLEIAIKQYGSHLYELGKKSLVETDPEKPSQEQKKPVSLFAAIAPNNQSVFTSFELN